MSGETERSQSAWTTDTAIAHLTAQIGFLRDLLEAQKDFQSERDRRYTEVSQEREKALKIKEQADRDALSLAREIQTYKDEKANELREQISRERGLYVTQQELKGVADKIEATMKPVVDFVSSQQGEKGGKLSQQQALMMIIGLVGSLILIGGTVIAIAFAIRQ